MTENKFFIIAFIISLVLLILFLMTIKKISIKEIFKNYASIYFGGLNSNNERRIALGYLFSFCFLPYITGIFWYLSFSKYLETIDSNLLLTFDGMLLTIMSVLFGFEIIYKKGCTEREKLAIEETNGVLFVGILLIVIDSLLLTFSNGDIPYITKRIILCIYYSIKVKIIILFFLALHNTYRLNNNLKSRD